MAARRKPASPRPIPGNPTLAELIREAITSRLLDVHTAIPAKVKSYNRATQTADCVPMIRHPAPVSDGSVELEEYPVIPNVPVGWLRGGGYSLQMPLAAGDFVLLIFSECDIARWRTSGELADPGDLRRHDLSYPIAFPCVAPDATALAAVGGALPDPTTAGNEAVLDGPSTIRIGGSAAEALATASRVHQALADLKNAISGAAVVAGDGGASFKTAIMTALSAWPPSLGTTKLKAE
jgi:hypothetical protein